MGTLDLRYMQRIRFTLNTIAAWPNHVFEDFQTTRLSQIHRYGITGLIYFLCYSALIGMAMYLIKYKNTIGFIELGQTCLTLLICLVYAERLTLPLRSTYRSIVKEFTLSFHLINHKDKSEFSQETYNRVNKICEIFTIIEHVQFYTSSFMFNAAPVYLNYKAGMFGTDKPTNVTFIHSLKYVLPFDQNEGIGRNVVLIVNWYASYNLGALLCCHDLLICVLIFHIWGHLTICEHNLKYFPRPRVPIDARTDSLRYSKEENEEVAIGLKEIIKNYIMIKKFVAKTSNAYSFSLFVYYGFHLVTDCILLLECSTMDPSALATYALLTVVMYQQLIQLSVVFELMNSKAESLIDAVYSLPWECMDNGNRRTVLMLLRIVQQPLSVKACGMLPVGVQTMAAVLKSSFSYFLMLKTFAN